MAVKRSSTDLSAAAPSLERCSPSVSSLTRASTHESTAWGISMSSRMPSSMSSGMPPTRLAMRQGAGHHLERSQREGLLDDTRYHTDVGGPVHRVDLIWLQAAEIPQFHVAGQDPALRSRFTRTHEHHPPPEGRRRHGRPSMTLAPLISGPMNPLRDHPALGRARPGKRLAPSVEGDKGAFVDPVEMIQIGAGYWLPNERQVFRYTAAEGTTATSAANPASRNPQMTGVWIRDDAGTGHGPSDGKNRLGISADDDRRRSIRAACAASRTAAASAQSALPKLCWVAALLP